MKTTSSEHFGHPTGLSVLFLTEMWERFSYYGMRALLVLYMTQHLLLQIQSGQPVVGAETLQSVLEYLFGPLSTQAMASQIYGLYTGFAYFTPFFGGILADRYFGQRKSVYIGALLMATGHFLMAFENLFFVALLFLVIGNGFFKPNVSTQVGTLYEQGDQRRDRAYTIFYMGVNLGAFFSPLVCGTLGQKFGWHYGFTAAGVGMLIGLVIYHLGRRHLPVEKTRVQMLQGQSEQGLSRDDYFKIAALGFLCVINILFWSVFEQQGNTMQILADQNTDWNILGWQMPSTWLQSFNPMFIFLFAPVIDQLWAWQHRRQFEPTSVTKMGIGCFLAALGFGLLYLILRQIGVETKINFLWLALATLLFTLGELYLSPIGLSLVTKLAPAKMLSMLMGVWFLSNFFGNYLAGYIGGYYEVLGVRSFFILMTAMAGFAGFVLVIAARPLRKLISN